MKEENIADHTHASKLDRVHKENTKIITSFTSNTTSSTNINIENDKKRSADTLDCLDDKWSHFETNSDKASDISSTATDEIEKTKKLFGDTSIVTKALIRYRNMKRAGKFKRRKIVNGIKL